jgi:hypothetical protein
MTRLKPGAALAGLVLLALTASAAPPDPVRELADRIDHHIAAKQKAEKVKPAPLADDAEFLRRVHLHIA